MRLSSYLALAAFVGVGGLLFVDDNEGAAQPVKPRAQRSAKLPAIVVAAPSLDAELVEDEDPTLELAEDEVEAVRGLAGELDLEQFAMVFSVDGTSYLRLSMDEEASARGRAVFIDDGGIVSVVAPVATAAMPDDLRKWAGRTVLVNGTCQARVIGFAEVSRVSGYASDPYAYDEHDNQIAPEPWTAELVREKNITLAAKLDGCHGTWARAESESPAAVAGFIQAPDLESAAIGELLAKHDHDERQESWKEQGGEGDWRDAVDLQATTWEHPFTNERWVFVQANTGGGGCGEAHISLMAAYQAKPDGTVRRFTDLNYAYDTISEIVDLDGDGQPELIFGGDDRAELVDLANESHGSIDVPSYGYDGCGC